MANEENLIPCGHKFTQEEAKRGGKASAEARRRKKLFKEILDEEFEKTVMLKNKDGEPAKEVTRKEAVGLRLMMILSDGNTKEKDFLKALEFARDTIGEKPVEKMAVAEVSQNVVEDVEKIVMEHEQK